MASTRPSNRAPSTHSRASSATRVQSVVAAYINGTPTNTAAPNYAADRYSRTSSASNANGERRRVGPAACSSSAVSAGPRILNQPSTASGGTAAGEVPAHHQQRGGGGRSASAGSRAASVASVARTASPHSAPHGRTHAPTPTAGGGAASAAPNPLITAAELMRFVDVLTLGDDGKSISLRYTRGLGGSLGDTTNNSVDIPTSSPAPSPPRDDDGAVDNADVGGQHASPSRRMATNTSSSRGTSLMPLTAKTYANAVKGTTYGVGHCPLSFGLMKSCLVLAPSSSSSMMGSGSSPRRGGNTSGNSTVFEHSPSSRRQSESTTTTVDPFAATASAMGSQPGSLYQAGSSRSVLTGNPNDPTSMAPSALDTTAVPLPAAASPAATHRNHGATLSTPIIVDYRCISRIRLYPLEMEVEAKGFIVSPTELRHVATNGSSSNGVGSPSSAASLMPADGYNSRATSIATAATSLAMVGTTNEGASSHAPGSPRTPTICVVSIAFDDKQLLDLCYRMLMCKTKGIVMPRAANRSASAAAAGGNATSSGNATEFGAILPGQQLLQQQQEVVDGEAGTTDEAALIPHYADPSVRQPNYTISTYERTNALRPPLPAMSNVEAMQQDRERERQRQELIAMQQRQRAMMQLQQQKAALQAAAANYNSANNGGGQRKDRAAPRNGEGGGMTAMGQPMHAGGVTRVDPEPIPQTHTTISPAPVSCSGRPSPVPITPSASIEGGEGRPHDAVPTIPTATPNSNSGKASPTRGAYPYGLPTTTAGSPIGVVPNAAHQHQQQPTRRAPSSAAASNNNKQGVMVLNGGHVVPVVVTARRSASSKGVASVRGSAQPSTAASSVTTSKTPSAEVGTSREEAAASVYAPPAAAQPTAASPAGPPPPPAAPATPSDPRYFSNTSVSPAPIPLRASSSSQRAGSAAGLASREERKAMLLQQLSSLKQRGMA